MAVNRAAMVRRHHTHLLLPQAALGDPQRALFEEAVGPAGWIRDASEASTMSLQWNRGRAVLRLQTLGWFPLLVTIGPIGRAVGAHRDAAARLTAAVLANGGKSLTDRQLAEYLPQAQRRWQRALTERQRLEQAERLLEARQCPQCRSWSETSTTHCVGCRHRFSSADDAARDAAVRRASTTVEEAEATLADLARGVLLEHIGQRAAGPATLAEAPHG
jgi:hypothetical protein